MSSNLVKYGEYTADEAEKEAEEAADEASDLWKPPVGPTTFRFLPPKFGQKRPFRAVYEHFIEIPGAQSSIHFVCPRMQCKHDGLGVRRCKACIKADELRADGHPSSYEEAGNFLPKKRYYSNIILRSKPDRGVIVFPFGKTIHEQVTTLRRNEDVGGNFCDPLHGFDMVVDRKGQGKKTEYQVYPARGPSTPLSDDATVMNAWLESMNDLNRYARVPTDEEIDRLLSGGRRGDRGAGRGTGGGERPRGRTAADNVEYVDED